MTEKSIKSYISLIFGIGCAALSLFSLFYLFSSNLLDTGSPAGAVGLIVFLILIVPVLMLGFLSFMLIGYFVYGGTQKE